MISSTVAAPRANPVSPASGTRELFFSAFKAHSLREVDGGPRLDQRRDGDRVPVGEADAAMGGGLADRLRLRRAVDSVVLLREVDPHQADGIVGAGGDLRLLVPGLGVPEEVGVVVEGRV